MDGREQIYANLVVLSDRFHFTSSRKRPLQPGSNPRPRTRKQNASAAVTLSLYVPLWKRDSCVANVAVVCNVSYYSYLF